MDRVKILDNESKLDIVTKKVNVVYELGVNANLELFLYNYNESSEVVVNLNGDGAKVVFHYSCINIDDNTFNIAINHNASNTNSYIVNHGINKDNKRLEFNVIGNILHDSKNCECKQENQIINLTNGKSRINPNLLISNYDCNSAHSAYIGKFKDEWIFYLTSRGLSYSNALEILMRGLILNGGDSNNKLIKEFMDKFVGGCNG